MNFKSTNSTSEAVRAELRTPTSREPEARVSRAKTTRAGFSMLTSISLMSSSYTSAILSIGALASLVAYSSHSACPAHD